MSRIKKMYILLAVLFAICLAVFGVSRYEEHKEQIKSSNKLILELPGEDVTSLSWKYESEEFAFHKDKTWKYDEDEAFPVDEEKILELLEQFEELKASFVIEEVNDYGQYGLDNPACTIRIETAEDKYEILLGDFSEMNSERYVSIGDRNVYLVKNDPMESFGIELNDLILHDEIPEFEHAAEIQFTGKEAYKIVYEENQDAAYSEEDVYFVKKGEYKPLDTENVEDYLQAVKDVNLKDYVSYNVSADELAAYGLDHPELEIEVRYTALEDEEEEEEAEEKTASFLLSIARDPKEQKQVESDSKDRETDEGEDEQTEEITAYARFGDSQIVYRISGEDYRKLMAASYQELCHQEILPVDFEDIYQADIELEGKKYTFTSKKKKKDKVWYYKDEEVEIDDFKGALMALKASDFEKEQPEGKEEISLKLYLDNKNYPEIQLELYRDDGSFCIAVLDQEPVSHVDRSYVVDLVEAVHEIVLD